MLRYHSLGVLLDDGINFEFPHPILQGVARFRGGYGYAAEPIANAGVQFPVFHLDIKIHKIAYSVNGYPLVMERKDAKIVFLNFYPPSSDVRKDFWDSSTGRKIDVVLNTSDGGKLMVNALRYVSGKYKKPLYVADSEVLS